MGCRFKRKSFLTLKTLQRKNEYFVDLQWT